jgi:hypothetical protein
LAEIWVAISDCPSQAAVHCIWPKTVELPVPNGKLILKPIKQEPVTGDEQPHPDAQPTLTPVRIVVAVDEYPAGHAAPVATKAPMVQIVVGGATHVLPQQLVVGIQVVPHILALLAHGNEHVLLLQTPTVFAWVGTQSALVQQPALGTHRLVPGQFLNPGLHEIVHVPLLQTAEPFDVGIGHELQATPQKLVLVSG